MNKSPVGSEMSADRRDAEAATLALSDDNFRRLYQSLDASPAR
jgi:hypothetical protein